MEDAIFEKIINDLRFGDGDPLQVIKKLEEIANESHIPQLQRLLQDDNFFIRETAAGPYAQLMGVRALPLLLQAQIRGYEDGHDNDGLDAVIMELVEVRKTEISSTLLEMLTKENPKTRAQAAWLLGFVASEINPTPLFEALHDESPRVRAEAAGALSSFAGHPNVLEALLDALNDQDEQVRVSVVSALGDLGDTRALSALQTVLQDSSERVWCMATDAIKQLKKSGKKSIWRRFWG